MWAAVKDVDWQPRQWLQRLPGWGAVLQEVASELGLMWRGEQSGLKDCHSARLFPSWYSEYLCLLFSFRFQVAHIIFFLVIFCFLFFILLLMVWMTCTRSWGTLFCTGKTFIIFIPKFEEPAQLTRLLEVRRKCDSTSLNLVYSSFTIKLKGIQ